MNYPKRLKINYLILPIFLFTIFIGCSDKEKKSNVIVKVNDSELTEDAISDLLENSASSNKTREEIINDWIEREILYQEAVKNGITDTEQYQNTLARSRKELAIGLFLQKMLEHSSVEISEEEILDFYEKYKDDFKLVDDAYTYNIIYFSSFDTAVKFRNMLLDSDWNKTLVAFRGDPSLDHSYTNYFSYKYNLMPVSLRRILTILHPLETSTVFQVEENKYCVVQLIQKLEKDSHPQPEIIKKEIKERVQLNKNRDYLKKYINNLIEDHNLVLERYSE
jgi:hypothetical protein